MIWSSEPNYSIRDLSGTAEIDLLYSNIYETSLVSKVKGANYPAVSNKIVLDVNIPVPPIDLQEKFSDIVKQTELLKTKYQDSEKELNNLFGSLMQRAFKGEL